MNPSLRLWRIHKFIMHRKQCRNGVIYADKKTFIKYNWG